MLPSPPPRQLAQLRQRVNPPRTVPPAPAAGPIRDDPVGTTRTFQVAAVAPAPPGTYTPLRTHLVVKTDHAYWYVQDGLRLSARDLQVSADTFERRSYPTVHALFGWTIPLGIDNDRHVTILIAHLAGAGTYFGYDDLLPRWVAAHSNERKLIYVDVDSAEPGMGAFDTTIGRSLAQLAWDTGHPAQDYWIKGGMNLVAAETMGGSLDGLLDSTVFGVFGLDPEVQLNAWRPSEVNPTSYALVAATYLFARYVADRFGASAIFPAVFAAPGRGVAAYDHAFRSIRPPTTFDDVFGDWAAANALNDRTLADGRFGYRGDLTLNPKVLPGPTLTSSIGGQASQFGATYYQIEPKAAATLRFVGDRTVPLVGANPNSGGYEWWSNRGDLIDSRLTRPVDLRSVKTATLRFWTWFDTEKNFDYAYVEVSTDGGATWRTCVAPGTSRDDPNGVNLGDGFTGTSGGDPPRWIRETVDLTPYVGRAILLRFEYVTDQAVEGDGFVVDGVEIPEIDFHDDASTDDGWTAEGFLRTDNLAPQPWLVEVIEHDARQPVRRLRIGPDGTGSLALTAGESAVVAVAGMAPGTSQRATFQLSLSAR